MNFQGCRKISGIDSSDMWGGGVVVYSGEGGEGAEREGAEESVFRYVGCDVCVCVGGGGGAGKVFRRVGVGCMYVCGGGRKGSKVWVKRIYF